MFSKNCVLVFVVLVLVLFQCSDVFSYPTGVAGRTKKTSSDGCSSCHIYGNSVTGVFAGMDTVIAGQSYTFSLTLSSTSGTGKYGVDVAVKNGILSVISGEGLKLLSGELVHSAGINYVSPKTVLFTYTAPAIAGVDTLYATIVRGYQGKWYYVPNKGVVVKMPTAVNGAEVPMNFYLSQNFPNPFNPVTRIDYGVARACAVRLAVYDLLGREVKVIVGEFKREGKYFAVFDASGFSTGVYFYRFEAEGFTEVRKMILMR